MEFNRWARRFARRVQDVTPPTARGVLVGLLAAGSLWLYGFGRLDLVLFVLGSVGLLLFGFAGVAVSTTAFVLRRRLDPPSQSADPGLSALRLEADSLLPTGFKVPCFRYLPWVKLTWQWVEPAGVECRIRHVGDVWTEEVVFHRRLLVQEIHRRFTVYDVFGLSAVAWQRSYPTALRVLPAKGRLRHLPVVQSMSAAEGWPHPAGAPTGDRLEIRRYSPGDSVRHILWKTFARTRQLNVRMPERSVDRAQRTVAYLVTGPDDEPAAGAARVALESGALGDHWIFGADGSETPADRLEPALVLLARSGAAPSRPGLGSFLEQMARQGELHCIVFAPARTGPWTAEVLRLAQRSNGTLSLVLATDGVAPADRLPRWQRFLLRPLPAPGTPAAELSRLLHALRSVGCPLVVVDRTTGRSFGSGHRFGEPLVASGVAAPGVDRALEVLT